MRFLSPAALRFLLPALLIGLLVACSEEESGQTEPDSTATPTAASTLEPTVENLEEATPTEPAATSTTAAPTTEPGETATATAAPASSDAYAIANGPAHFVYIVSEGDTFESIAAMFDAGDDSRLDPGELADLNGVDDEDLVPGMPLAIPVLLPSAQAIMPENTIQGALGANLPLLQPSREMIDGYLGRIALYRVTLHPQGSDDGPGYVMEYWFTERPGFRAGEIDTDARYVDPVFTLAAGSLLDHQDGDAIASESFQRDGVEYAIHTYFMTELAPAQLISMLETAGERE